MADGKRRAPLARWERVRRFVLDGIARGQWREGDRLPSEPELVARLGLARMTVNRALRELAEAGLVRRVPGVGSFVATPPPRAPLIELRDIADDIAARGHSHSQRVLAHEQVRADAVLAAAFGVRRGAALFHSRVLHFEAREPVQLEDRHVLPAFAPGYLGHDFARETTGHYLAGIAPADEVEHVVEACVADACLRRLLALAPGEPCLRLTRRTWVAGQPVTRTVFTHPGRRWRLGSRYPTKAGKP